MTSSVIVKLEPDQLGEEPEAEVVGLLAEDGAGVKAGDPIVEVETAKASLEISAPVAGSIRFLVQVGEVVAAGAALATIDGG